MRISFENQTVLTTGGSGGIGASLASCLTGEILNVNGGNIVCVCG